MLLEINLKIQIHNSNDEHKNKLELIDIWFWNKKTYMFNKYNLFIQKFNRFPSKNSSKEEVALYNWYIKNKELVNKNQYNFIKKKITIEL